MIRYDCAHTMNSFDTPSPGKQRSWRVVFLCLTALAVLRMVGVAAFMVDPSETRFVAHRANDFGIHHNCFTCYAVAVRLAQSGRDVYDSSLYRKPEKTTDVHRQIGETFSVDSFEYPPPFLALPALVMSTGGGFFRWRAIWFALTVALFATSLFALARWAGAFREHAGLLALSAVFLAPTTNMGIQIGNVHLLVVGASLLGVLALTARREMLGALLLSFAICTKLWPGVLLVPLLVQRRWRAITLTSLGVILWSLLAYAFVGAGPFKSFATEQFGLLASGEAFSFAYTNKPAILENVSVLGLPSKLHLLGILSMDPDGFDPILNFSFTALLLLAIVVAGIQLRKLAQIETDRSRLDQVLLWLALLTLVQLRSPFLPWAYGVASTLCLLVFLIPGAKWRSGVLIGLATVILAMDLPLPMGSANASIWWSMAGTLVMLIAAAITILRGSR
jgi:alpha-1,2-mannosyltransferase